MLLRKPDRDKAQSGLNEVRLTNYELWVCLLAGEGRMSGESIDSIARNYLSGRTRPVSSLYESKSKKINPVLKRFVFNYDFSPEEIGDLEAPYNKDISSLIGIIAVNCEWGYDDELMKPVMQLEIAELGRMYSDVIRKLFKGTILPHLAKDELILAAREKHYKPKVVNRKELERLTARS